MAAVLDWLGVGDGGEGDEGEKSEGEMLKPAHGGESLGC